MVVEYNQVKGAAKEIREMKEYGPMKATEFTKKQIGIIYRAAKNGELKVEKWVMSEMYDLADYYDYDSNGNVARKETGIINIINMVLEGDLKSAQNLLDMYAKEYDLYGKKAQANMSREFV